MGRPHINDNGEFESDKYSVHDLNHHEGSDVPTLGMKRTDMVGLKLADPAAQDLLWQYADRRRSVDAEFAEDLQARLLELGHQPAGFEDICPKGCGYPLSDHSHGSDKCPSITFG